MSRGAQNTALYAVGLACATWASAISGGLPFALSVIAGGIAIYIAARD